MSEHTCRTCLHHHVSAARYPCLNCFSHARWAPNPFRVNPAPAHTCACDATRTECDALRKQLSDARIALARTRLAAAMGSADIVNLGLNELSKALADPELDTMLRRAITRFDLTLEIGRAHV